MGPAPPEGLQRQEANRRRPDRTRDGDPAEPRVRAHQALLPRGVRHREPVLHEPVDLRQDEHQQDDREEQVRIELRGEEQGQQTPAGGGGECHRAARTGAVEDRNDQRTGQGERQHREAEEQRDAQP